jgi:hypothetical protein
VTMTHIGHFKGYLIGFALIGMVCIRSVFAQGGAPVLLGQFDDWSAYAAEQNNQKVCFALSRPQSLKSDPNTAARGKNYLMVTIRPSQKVWSEFSILMDYKFAPNSQATAEIGTATFALYTKDDGAWIRNPGEEDRLIDTMRRGSTVVIKGMSTSGMRGADQYFLKSFGQAIDRAVLECRRESAPTTTTTTTTTTTPNRSSQPESPCKRFPNLC